MCCMYMKKTVISFVLIFILGLSASAQFNKSNLTFGGRLGLQFGDYTLINVAPQVGYNFTNYLNAGAGVSYSYYNQKSGDKSLQEINSYLGLNVYAKFYPLPFIVVMAQPEINRVWHTLKYRNTGSEFKENKMVPVFLVGAGVRMGPVTAMLQYDLVQDGYSPYGGNIFYSLGYTFSF